MVDNHATDASSTLAPASEQASDNAASSGFFRRYRLPLTLAVIALCLYVGSISYMIFGRGQIL